ncbi:MAG: proprotein convertase P-domain-containing protein [Myxococcales bacterium]|nr:proprotein convertase P-domain-containing protein [Myxococcales bacterium]
MSIISKISVLALASTLLVGCAEDAATTSDAPATSATYLDQVGRADQPASLVVLAPTATAADRERVEGAIAQLGGTVVGSLPPRLIIATIPAGAERVLADAGVVARFDRAVTPADLAAPTLAEERFLAVHAARWFPADVPMAARLAPTARLRADGEREGTVAPFAAARIAAGEPGAPVDPDDAVAVPYASGTIVVSIVLPESNGSIDASTEDWTEAMVRETYLKIATALDKVAATDRNADLRFVIHAASAPAAGGLVGTVDTAYEFGQRANWGGVNTEYLATADVLGKILGRPLTEFEVGPAAVEYTADLKRQYHADGAFFVIVAANGNGTAGLRAHAFINGPWTVLDTGYGHETFMHEFGHIFGALDEYCPDACVPPFSVAGYLGMYNANAQAQQGAGGIDDGRGESASSLMQYNQPGAVNGYTRGAWGWIDSDGDGVIEVRDTVPASELRLTADRQRVRVTGTIVDRPATRVWAAPYSVNRIVALEYAFAATGPWLRLPLPGDTRGRQAVDVELGQLPGGTRTVWLRGVNSVGNVEPRPVALSVTTTGTANSAPHGRLDLPARAGSATALTLTTGAVDLDGDAVTVRYDLDGNGTWDTSYRALGAYAFTPTAGLRTVRAQFKDARNATRVVTATLPVVTGAAPATITLGAVPSQVYGANPARITAAVAAPGATLSATATLATDDDVATAPVTIAADGTLAVDLPTPRSLRTRPLDLAAGDRTLGNNDVRDLAVLDGNLIAVAAGTGGVWIVDVTDRAAPRVVAQVALETTAHRLRKVGTKLFVLGSYLTVLDIADPRAPRELKQWFTTSDTATAASQETIGISDGDGGYATHGLSTGLGGRISRTTVRVTIDHPNPADLVIRLVPWKGSALPPVVLWDHRAAAGGLRTLTFSSTSTPALRALDGAFADGYWSIEVQDDQANGQGGQLLGSQLDFTARSRAARVITNASELAGVTSFGELVVAGDGVQVVDVAVPQWMMPVGAIAGTGTYSATMIDDAAIVSAPLEAKNPDGSTSTAPVRGLCAIDLTYAAPRLVRCDATIEARDHAQIAGRLYVGTGGKCQRDDGACEPPATIVGSARNFARGWAWRLGTTPLRVDRWAFGDAAAVWTVNEQGAVDRLNVANPAAVTVAERFARTYTTRLVPLRLPEVILFDFGAMARLATLGDAWSILSRVYRLTITATNAAGAATTVTRHVHVVPYDHAPTAVTTAIVPPKDGIGGNHLQITVVDPDDGSTWDPTRFARVDWDGDGSFDTDWLWMGADGEGRFVTDLEIVPGAAARTAIVEARDGFWARARTSTVLP